MGGIALTVIAVLVVGALAYARWRHMGDRFPHASLVMKAFGTTEGGDGEGAPARSRPEVLEEEETEQ